MPGMVEFLICYYYVPLYLEFILSIDVNIKLLLHISVCILDVTVTFTKGNIFHKARYAPNIFGRQIEGVFINNVMERHLVM